LETQDGDIYNAVKSLRKYLSVPQSDCIQCVKELGLIPYLASLLDNSSEEILIEITWSLTNLTAGSNECCEILCDLGVHVKLLELLNTENVELKKEVMWAITNLSAGNTKVKNLLINKGLITKIVNILSTPNLSLFLLRNICWLISVLCSKCSKAYYTKLKDLFPYFKALIEMDDENVNRDILQAIYFITEIPDPNTSLDIIHYINLKPIIKHLPPFTSISIKILGNLCALNEDCVNNLIQREDILTVLSNLLVDNKNEADVAWMLSNMGSGPSSNLKEILNSGIMEKLCYIGRSSNYSVKRQAIFALANLCLNANEEFIWKMVNLGTLDCMINEMSMTDIELVQVVLNTIEEILIICEPVEGDNEMYEKFNSIGGRDKLLTLAQSKNKEIADLANKLLDYQQPIN